MEKECRTVANTDRHWPIYPGVKSISSIPHIWFWVRFLTFIILGILFCNTMGLIFLYLRVLVRGLNKLVYVKHWNMLVQSKHGINIIIIDFFINIWLSGTKSPLSVFSWHQAPGLHIFCFLYTNTLPHPHPVVHFTQLFRIFSLQLISASTENPKPAYSFLKQV